MILLDCTLRDGGYYNNWDFEPDLVKEYLKAMDLLKIDFIEIGFRTLKNDDFKGALAFSSDNFINNLKIPQGLTNKIGVMLNGSEIANQKTQIKNLKKLFNTKSESPITLVRIACHADEFVSCLPAVKWLKKQNYLVGINLMQISEIPLKEISRLAKQANAYPIDVLYFADTLGSLDSHQLENIINAFKKEWTGALGIHAHDNTGQAVSNSVQAVKSGITWVDSTVTGMGRGAGNAQTEYISLALQAHRKTQGNSIKLLEIIRKYFKKIKNEYGWGTNPFYYLCGKKSIHPSYVQKMLKDQRYGEEDIMAVIDFLEINGGKKFNSDNLETARYFYSAKSSGTWKPDTLLKNKNFLILGSGPSISKYQNAIESYIEKVKPYVVALNTQSNIRQHLINARIACHPIRLLGDSKDHIKLPQPLITPFSMLPDIVKKNLKDKKILDFGIAIKNKKFKFFKNYCELPSSLVFAYSLAVANSGLANQIILAGFDGYDSEDPRYQEMDKILKIYEKTTGALNLKSITPTRYNISIQSVFGLNS
jgi:4-hydroxy 2-oxovalerate aldolase